MLIAWNDWIIKKIYFKIGKFKSENMRHFKIQLLIIFIQREFICTYGARAKSWCAQLRAPPIRAHHHILWKVAKNDMYVASDMARSARGSGRAQIELSKSDWSIKIDAFSLFDHCHSFKTHRDTESWSLVKNFKSNFWHLRYRIFSKI